MHSKKCARESVYDSTVLNGIIHNDWQFTIYHEGIQEHVFSPVFRHKRKYSMHFHPLSFSYTYSLPIFLCLVLYPLSLSMFSHSIWHIHTQTHAEKNMSISCKRTSISHFLWISNSCSHLKANIALFFSAFFQIVLSSSVKNAKNSTEINEHVFNLIWVTMYSSI